MRTIDTFGVQFMLRTSRLQNGKYPVYARITVNKSRCELALKQNLQPAEWNNAKGMAKPKNDTLRQFNSYLEEVRGKLARHYRDLLMEGKPFTAATVKDAYGGQPDLKKEYSLLWLMAEHNKMMKQVLKKGTMKNYLTTERYLKAFLKLSNFNGDVLLKEIRYDFITGFEYFIRNTPLKTNDPCTNNGTMKHLERLKKILAWAVKNEWIDKHPFGSYQLKFKKTERSFLTDAELISIEKRFFDNEMLQKVSDLFVFSCYTGLAYADMTALKKEQIITGNNHTKWIMTTRAKTETLVQVPLLKQAFVIAEKYINDQAAAMRETVFPMISNQEINRSLKIIAAICGIKKYLTFHLARHTFATTVTLMNGVPIESISKMLGHTKLSTTMIYAKVTQTKIGMDMEQLQNKLDAPKKTGYKKSKIVKLI